MISTLLGVSLVLCFSSDSSEGGNSLLALESSSSSESLNTFRQIYVADYKRTIFEKIRCLESAQYYNLPPQTRPREYESIVRAHFDQAVSVDHLRSVMDMKGSYKKRNLISKDNLECIMELSPHNNIRKEAYDFIEGEEDYNEKDPRPEQVGLGYRAIRAVGGDKGRAHMGMINSLVVGNLNSSIFEICLSRSITICSLNGPLNLSEIVVAQKQIWSDIPLFPILKLIELQVEAELVAGYNVEYAQDVILNSPLLAKANVSGSQGLILTEQGVLAGVGHSSFFIRN
ncbi:hypothetical protein CXB51_005993 [Gossypium anomalum]|uniref:Uncharacterized protein n=1 Tax=Gossypium anomalum TaxID=47600 RepID=A0A8J5ZMY0_9ROSI|nr:hypothetical protein CXB51_005993 [Gossypium anomalum]